MSSCYEYYNTGDDYGSWFGGSNWRGQTFTPAEAHKITSVKLLLYRSGSPGTVTVSIRATDGSGHPTGADLCSGTTDGDTLPTASPYEWREITLGAGYDLEADTKYAIVVRAEANYIIWRGDDSSPTYTGGNAEQSSDSGSSWTAVATRDYMFEEWGDPLVIPKTSSDAGSGADATPSLEVSLGIGDTGTGADTKASGSPIATLTKTETGVGADSITAQLALLVKSESGSGIDSPIARLLATFDSGSGIEASSLFYDLLKDLFASELGEGSDCLTAKIEMPTKGGGMKLWT